MTRSAGVVWGMTLALGALGVLAWTRSQGNPPMLPSLTSISHLSPNVPAGKGKASAVSSPGLLPQAPDFSARSLASLEAQGAQKDGATVWWIPFVIRAVDFRHLYPAHNVGLRSGSGNLK